MIHIFEDDKEWHIWTDTEDGDRTGRCIGSGLSRTEALQDAIAELKRDLEQARVLHDQIASL